MKRNIEAKYRETKDDRSTEEEKKFRAKEIKKMNTQYDKQSKAWWSGPNPFENTDGKWGTHPHASMSKHEWMKQS